MIERNRNTDKEDISRLESKIKALESDIVIAKQLGEERRLDKLELSLTNTSIPALNDNSLLDDLPEDQLDREAALIESPLKQQKELMNRVAELIASGTGGKENENVLHDSVLHEDELAILGDYAGHQSASETDNSLPAGKKTSTGVAKNIINEYDEYEKQLMREIRGLESKV